MEDCSGWHRGDRGGTREYFRSGWRWRSDGWCVVCRAGRPLVWSTGHSTHWRAWPATDIPARSVSGQAAGDIAAWCAQRSSQSVSAGVDWGQLPEGRKWGSTASITTAPDGTIWVADRCGVSGAGGTTCGGANAGVNPIFQFDTSGKLLKKFGAGHLHQSPQIDESTRTGSCGWPTTAAIRSSSSIRTARSC